MNSEECREFEAYITMLKQALQQKQLVLDELLVLTEEQERLFIASELEEAKFDELVKGKKMLIQRLEELDHGFEQVYQRIGDEIRNNKYQYQNDVEELQRMITGITDRTMKLRAIEQHNYIKFQNLLKAKRTEIKAGRKSSQMVSNYYKNAAVGPEAQSFFYDKKK